MCGACTLGAARSASTHILPGLRLGRGGGRGLEQQAFNLPPYAPYSPHLLCISTADCNPSPPLPSPLSLSLKPIRTTQPPTQSPSLSPDDIAKARGRVRQSRENRVFQCIVPLLLVIPCALCIAPARHSTAQQGFLQCIVPLLLVVPCALCIPPAQHSRAPRGLLQRATPLCLGINCALCLPWRPTWVIMYHVQAGPGRC